MDAGDPGDVFSRAGALGHDSAHAAAVWSGRPESAAASHNPRTNGHNVRSRNWRIRGALLRPRRLAFVSARASCDQHGFVTACVRYRLRCNPRTVTIGLLLPSREQQEHSATRWRPSIDRHTSISAPSTSASQSAESEHGSVRALAALR